MGGKGMGFFDVHGEISDLVHSNVDNNQAR